MKLPERFFFGLAIVMYIALGALCGHAISIIIYLLL